MLRSCAQAVQFLAVLVLALLPLALGCEISDERLPVAAAHGDDQSPDESLVPVAGPPRIAPAGYEATVRRGHVDFIAGFEAGMQQARYGNRPILVFFTARWCRYCHEMADEAFTHPEVVALAKNFCCILIDVDAEPQVVNRLGVRAFPTVQFLAPSGARLTRITGKKSGPEVARQMRAALHAFVLRIEPSPPARR